MEPKHCRTLGEVGRVVEVAPATLRAIRDRDCRFPGKAPAGWPVAAVRLLLAIRKLQRYLAGPDVPDADREVLNEVVTDCEQRLRNGSPEKSMA